MSTDTSNHVCTAISHRDKVTRERKTHTSSNAESDRKQNCDHLHWFRAAVPVQTYTQSDNQSTTYFVRTQYCWFQTNLVPLSRISLWYNIQTYTSLKYVPVNFTDCSHFPIHTDSGFCTSTLPPECWRETSTYSLKIYQPPAYPLYTHA